MKGREGETNQIRIELQLEIDGIYPTYTQRENYRRRRKKKKRRRIGYHDGWSVGRSVDVPV